MSMMNAKGAFIKELMQSKEYVNLKNAKLNLSKNPDYNGEVIRLNKLQEQIYDQQMKNEDVKAATEQLNKEYERVSAIPEIKYYLQATAAMNAMLNKIISDINVAIDSSLR